MSFVDDSSLNVTSVYRENPVTSAQENILADVQHTVHHLKTLAQHWEKLLFSMGGTLHLQKCHWYLMQWAWRNGKVTQATSRHLPIDMSLTAGYSVTPEVIPRIEPHDSFCTLGVHIAPDGSQHHQLQVLRRHSENYKSNIASSTLSSEEAYYSI